MDRYGFEDFHFAETDVDRSRDCGEIDRVDSRLVVCVNDRLPQATRAEIGEVGHCKVGKQASVFERF
ncbi:MAG: hypothetical protein R3C10_02915 [Pirellulales bacterium]